MIFGPHHEQQLMRIEQKLDQALRQLAQITQTEIRMSQELDDLNAAVTKINTTVTAAVTDIQSLAQQIKDASANGDGPAVEAAATQLSALADTLNAALPPRAQAA